MRLAPDGTFVWIPASVEMEGSGGGTLIMLRNGQIAPLPGGHRLCVNDRQYPVAFYKDWLYAWADKQETNEGASQPNCQLVRLRYSPTGGISRPEVLLPNKSFPLVPEDGLRAPFANIAYGEQGYVREGDPLSAMMQPLGGGYAGQVVVFADGLTNSAAVETLTALLAFRSNVLLVGQETGGECGRHIGEMPIVYSAHSLQILISLFELTHVAVPGCEPGHGYRPRREVVYDERAFLAGSDPYLDALK